MRRSPRTRRGKRSQIGAAREVVVAGAEVPEDVVVSGADEVVVVGVEEVVGGAFSCGDERLFRHLGKKIS
jgi:hypothetical protein